MLASLVRLQGDDFNDNAGAGRITRQHAYVQHSLDAIRRRAGLVKGDVADEALVDAMVQQRIDEWLSRAGSVTGGAVLGYEPRKDGRTRGLLRQPTDLGRDLFTCLNSFARRRTDRRAGPARPRDGLGSRQAAKNAKDFS